MGSIAAYVAFDLEGPLTPQDAAFELMKLFPDGGRVFAAISRYDDLLTIEEKSGYQPADYEPGDTLALIVPFLVLHGVTERDIVTLAAQAPFIGGAKDIISRLQYRAWKVHCITTTYEQYALHLTQKLGIYAHNVACTRFPLDQLRTTMTAADAAILRQMETDLLALPDPPEDAALKALLDAYFWQKLPATSIGGLINQVKPVGGRRKVAALERFSQATAQPFSRWVYAGDSITDARVLQAVEDAGGLAIAFNANQYALQHATAALASTHISDLGDFLDAWSSGGRKAAERFVKERERAGGHDNRGYFHWLSGRQDIAPVLEVHRRIRRTVREEAGKLG